MAKRIILLSFILFLSSTTVLQATHIVGGELRYRCLDNNRFEVYLTIYRDCFYGDPNAWFDDPASIGIFDGNSDTLVTSLGTAGQILIPLMGNDTLDPSLNDPCLIVPPSVCVHTTTYIDTVTLPFREGGYTLAYQRCCRNETLQNIVNPLASGATYLVRVTERALELGNSSPEFRDWPPIYICTDRPIDFDHSAIDSDGDSLVYELCTPLLGANQINPRPQPPFNPPYDPVVWVDPPYNLNNLLGGVPLTIDSSTGFMTGIPNNPGQYVVGVCVEEYRNGELIGRLRRDFQYNVGVCGNTISAFTASDTTCADHSIRLINESEFATSYTWLFGDPDQPDSISIETEPFVGYSEPGEYQVTLIAFNAESGCRDTSSKIITVQPFLAEADIDWNTISCTDSFYFDLSITDLDTIPGDPIAELEWIIRAGMNEETSTEGMPSFAVVGVDTVFITLEVLSEAGCNGILRDTIIVDFISDPLLPDSLSICPGDSIRLNPEHTAQDLMFAWSPDDGSLDDPTAANPLAYPADSRWYTATISNAFGCMMTDSVYVRVYPNIPSFTINASQGEVQAGDPFTLSIPFDSSYREIQWHPSQNVEPDTGLSVTATIDDQTTFLVTVVDSFGCMRSDSITIQIVECPPADTLRGGLASNLCLVGTGYDEQIMEVDGFIPVHPEFELCGFDLDSLEGGYFVLDDYHVNPMNGFIKFQGWLHITDPSAFEQNGNRILAQLRLCTSEGYECPLPVSIPIFMGTAGMCRLKGMMCNNFLLDWAPFSPQIQGDLVNNSFQVYLPFLTKLSSDTCQMTTVEAEISIKYTHLSQLVIYDTYTLSPVNGDNHLIWNETISLCTQDYLSAEYMNLTFRNNCGDTCSTSLDFKQMWRSSGKQESATSIEIKISPNPVSDELSFSYESTGDQFDLQLLNSRGTIVQSDVRSGTRSRHSLSVEQLPTGLYFLFIRDSGKTAVRRFIKL